MQQKGQKTKCIQGGHPSPRETFLLISIPYSIWISYSKETHSCVWNQLFIVFHTTALGKLHSLICVCLGLPGVQLLL